MTDNFIEESSSGNKYYLLNEDFNKSDFFKYDIVQVRIESKILKLTAEFAYYKPSKKSDKSIKGISHVWYNKSENPDSKAINESIDSAYTSIKDIIRGISCWIPTKYEIFGIITPKNSLKGIKTAVWGKKSHRNDTIKYLENSVRRMF